MTSINYQLLNTENRLLRSCIKESLEEESNKGKDVMQWVPMAHKGIVITPLDTHLMSAIIGLYFGGSLVKK